jgi:hypothetical protein
MNHWHSNFKDTEWDLVREELVLDFELEGDIQRIISRLEQDSTARVWLIAKIVTVYAHS